MSKFNEVKEKVLLSNYAMDRYSCRFESGKLRFEECPFCGHRDCTDVYNNGKFQTFNCFSCQKQGTIIDFYCYEHDLDPSDKVNQSIALKNLCEMAGIDNNNINTQEADSNSSQSILERQNDVSRVSKQVKDYDFTEIAEKLHDQLLNNQEAMNYFLGRGLSLDTIKKFKLGYEPKGINNSFDDYEELKLYEPLAECYTYFIPTFEKGICSYILPRLNTDILEKKMILEELYKTDTEGKERKYPKTMNLKRVPTTVFNFENAMSDDYVFVCEGWADALSIETLGYSALALNSVAGVNSFIRKIQEVKDYQTKYYIIALDNDEAGNKARNDLNDALSNLKCKVKHLYPIGKDINDMLVSNKEELNNAICNVLSEIKQEKQDILSKKSTFFFLEDIVKEFISNRDKPLLSTGYKSFDNALGGGIDNSLYVLGGISGVGKTALALNMAENITKQGRDVLFVSLELNRKELISRSLSRFTRETVKAPLSPLDYPTYTDIKRGNFNPKEQSFVNGYNSFKDVAKRLVLEEGKMKYTTDKIREDIINHKTVTGEAPVVIVDYLQKLKNENNYNDAKMNIDENISDLKVISGEFGIPVIALSSINRFSYKKQLGFEAFKGSGDIEFTADVVVSLQYSFMARESEKSFEVLEQEAKTKFPREVQAVVLKNRNGSIGSATDFLYEPQYNYFQEI